MRCEAGSAALGGGDLVRVGGLLGRKLEVDRGRLEAANGLRIESVADPEVGVDVVPVGRVSLELLAQLPDEDVDRPIAVRHRVAPDLLVDLLALDHLAVGFGEELEELELAASQADALAADERLVLVGTN